MVSFRGGTNSFLYHTFRKDTGDESSSWSIQILDLTGRSRGKPNQGGVVIKAIFLRANLFASGIGSSQARFRPENVRSKRLKRSFMLSCIVEAVLFFKFF